jgi:hypothetical protein
VVARWGPWTPARARDIELIKQRKLDRLAWAAFCATAVGVGERATPPRAGRCRRCGATVVAAVEVHRATAEAVTGSVQLCCTCVALRARVELRVALDGTPFGGVGSWYWRRRIPVATGPEVRP